ncbi:YbaK/aminoacyl-tRNA synthetase-associated domain [Pseudocohnilembus persalinus]|uniref:YbaK/aminoacyl-tRNA synthetase-associated domain n=1 Tax=Pseudocohnilembus persalinus TaxID=266149 RepID=A0A0V0QTT5_PSEPJ|nr:YbaK/aminoacyl-tRNA synthetase-associated domain [Pseudocohnilembus persalinus]|eukprot:KRX05402.1 YbaK/aminoacyl-tRNA synthetase-associated domain [Pseudocohnilembus persalinus]
MEQQLKQNLITKKEFDNFTEQQKQEFLQKCLNRLHFYFNKNNFKSVELITVPEIYYSKSLEWRKNILKAPKENYLCKTLLMVNKHHKSQRDSSIYNPKYIFVVVQYAAKLNMVKLHQFGRYIQNQNAPTEKEQIGSKGFHYRLVPESLQEELTGYIFNGVTPFDLLTEEKIPIFLPQELVPLEFFYLGGGHPDVKLRVSIDEFISKHEQPVFVGSFQDERPPSEWQNLVDNEGENQQGEEGEEEEENSK